MKIIKSKPCIILFFILIASGCSDHNTNQLPDEFQDIENLTVYSAESQSQKEISFKKSTVYGSSENTLIGKMGSLAVDRLGRLFIADVQKQVVYVFAPGGQFVTQLGGKGKGPGEFSYIKKLQIRNNHLYASDANFGVQSVSVFTLDTLSGDQTIILARNRSDYRSLARAYPGVFEIYVRDDSTFLAEFISHGTNPTKKWQNKEIRGLLYPLDGAGNIASDKLFEFTEEIRTYHKGSLMGLLPIKPFFGNACIVLSNDNSIYQAGPEYFLIKEYSPEGVYQKAFYYPIKKIPLSQVSARDAEIRELYIRNMDKMELPVTWPVLTNMKIDDQDRLWIATTVEDFNVYEWWILEKSGELITKFEWPRDKPIEEVRNGYMYTRERDEMDVESIVKYKIEME